MPSTVIYWVRRDFRLTDNSALHAAASQAAQVIPVHVLSQWRGEHDWTGAKRQQFLCGCIASMAKNLEAIGSRLILRAGLAVDELEKLARETQAEAIHFNAVPDPFGKAMETRVQAMCERLGIACVSHQDVVLHGANEVLTGDGRPYRVFTPYARNWLALPKAAALPRVRSLGPAAAASISSLALPTLEHWALSLPGEVQLLQAGERAAQQRMQAFISGGGLSNYGTHRDLPAGGHNSSLSQDLRFGLVGIRELYHCCQAVAQAMPSTASSVLTFTKELAWREFYMALLHFHPRVLETNFNADFDNVEWPGSDAHFEAWATARTGFPIVDAGMRQLLATGLMHNRVRMIVAMFLTKDLHCHWLRGEQFFHQHLLDAEIASNNGGWQWSAGTGADAAPYFRIQNPWTQTQRFDAEGRYIRQWLPELAGVATERFFEPPKDGRTLAPGYPLPIVEHGAERARTLARFKIGRG